MVSVHPSRLCRPSLSISNNRSCAQDGTKVIRVMVWDATDILEQMLGHETELSIGEHARGMLGYVAADLCPVRMPLPAVGAVGPRPRRLTPHTRGPSESCKFSLASTCCPVPCRSPWG
jgi:hypothetical protein